MNKLSINAGNSNCFKMSSTETLDGKQKNVGKNNFFNLLMSQYVLQNISNQSPLNSESNIISKNMEKTSKFSLFQNRDVLKMPFVNYDMFGNNSNFNGNIRNTPKSLLKSMDLNNLNTNELRNFEKIDFNKLLTSKNGKRQGIEKSNFNYNEMYENYSPNYYGSNDYFEKNSLVVTYGDIKIEPFNLVSILELYIDKKINDHVRLYFKAVIEESNKDKYAKYIGAESQISVKCTNPDTGISTIFKGYVLNIEVKCVRDIYYLEVNAISNTHLLDVKKNSRTFQDFGMSYEEVISKVIENYGGADFIDSASNDASTGKFILQYEEEDWKFINRLSSHFNQGLVADCTSEKPRFYFGVPDRGNAGSVEDYHFSVKKDLDKYRISTENGLRGGNEENFMHYEVETNKMFEIGTTLKFKEEPLIIKEAHTRLNDGVLKNVYHLTNTKGLEKNMKYNEGIKGVSLQGKIIDVARDQVKIKFDIDEHQSKTKACWFPYSTVYTSESNAGLYLMPELNERARLYLPQKREEECVALSSVRTDFESEGIRGNPDIKYLRTKDRKEVRLAPEEIVISAHDGSMYIRMNENSGVEIISDKPINIKSTGGNGITIESQKKIVIAAKEEINIECKESKINMKDGNTIIRGNEVKTN